MAMTHLCENDLSPVCRFADVHCELYCWTRENLVAREVVQAHGHSAFARPMKAHAHARPREQGCLVVFVCKGVQ